MVANSHYGGKGHIHGKGKAVHPRYIHGKAERERRYIHGKEKRKGKVVHPRKGGTSTEYIQRGGVHPPSTVENKHEFILYKQNKKCFWDINYELMVGSERLIWGYQDTYSKNLSFLHLFFPSFSHYYTICFYEFLSYLNALNFLFQIFSQI